MEDRANLQMGYEIHDCWEPYLTNCNLDAIARIFHRNCSGVKPKTKCKYRTVESLLNVDFVYHFHLFAVPLKKTIQRELKCRAKIIFMRSCPYQLILFVYWAIVLPQNYSFDTYICIYSCPFSTQGEQHQ